MVGHGRRDVQDLPTPSRSSGTCGFPRRTTGGEVVCQGVSRDWEGRVFPGDG